jgi:ABC-type glycerol-3-phosphate transport system permease component
MRRPALRSAAEATSRHAGAATARHALLFVASLVTLGPLLWIVTLALRPQREFLNDPFGLPRRLYLDNFVTIFTNERMVHFFYNSVVTTAGAVLLVATASTLAGYALARIYFRGSRFLLMLYLIGETIPVFVVLIPLFILIQLLGLSGSRWSLILTYGAMNMGISVFFMRGFFRTIPTEMEDAARIEGCGILRLIRHVLLPLVRPGLLVVLIFNFISLWNEYYLASILLPSQELFTLPAGLAASFSTVYATNWPAMAAGIVLSVLPVLTMFVLAQDRIVDGWTMSGK